MKRLVPSFASAVLIILLMTGCRAPGTGVPRGTNVSGTLLWPDGQAAAGRALLVAGQRTTTGPDGRFAVEGVETPYDVVVTLTTATGLEAAIVFVGFTAPAPVVVLPPLERLPEQSVQLTIDPIGADVPPAPPAGSINRSFVGCSGDADWYNNCGGYGLLEAVPSARTVTWSGQPSSTLGIFAVQGQASDMSVGRFTNYTRFGYTPSVRLVAGEPVSVPLLLDAVETRTMTGTVSLPAGYSLSRRGIGFSAGEQRLGEFSFEGSAGGPLAPGFNFAAPVVSELGLYFYAKAESGDAYVESLLTSVAPDATGLTVDLPAPPQLSRPAHNTVGVSASTTFEWSPVPDAVYALALLPDAPGALAYLIFTTDTQATLPDLAALEVPLPRGVKYTWSVSTTAPLASMDALADGVYFGELGSTWGRSADRTATTAP